MKVVLLDTSVEYFIQSLNAVNHAKAIHMIELLEEFGHRLSMPHSKMITRGLFELRIKGSPAIRLFYIFHNNKGIIIHGFTKKSAKTPTREIKIAQQKVNVILD